MSGQDPTVSSSDSHVESVELILARVRKMLLHPNSRPFLEQYSGDTRYNRVPIELTLTSSFGFNLYLEGLSNGHVMYTGPGDSYMPRSPSPAPDASTDEDSQDEADMDAANDQEPDDHAVEDSGSEQESIPDLDRLHPGVFGAKK